MELSNASKNFLLTREFNAPKSLVWQAHSIKEKMSQWWGPKGFELEVKQFDFNTDGIFHYSMKLQNGEKMWGKIVFKEIILEKKLSFHVSFSNENCQIIRHPANKTWPQEIHTTLTFVEERGITRLTLLAKPIQANAEEEQTFQNNHNSMKAGFSQTFDQLNEFLMQEMYGPLSTFLGAWTGDKGLDIAPEEDGEEKNPYNERIVFEGVGLANNAKVQTLGAIHYTQVVRKKLDYSVIHHQTGYLYYDHNTKEILYSLTIPRAVAILAKGSVQELENNKRELKISTDKTSSPLGILESEFMHKNASTTRFEISFLLDKYTLSYSQTTSVQIYGKSFEHTDKNELKREI